MKRIRRNQLLAAAAGVVVSGAFASVSHAQAVFDTQDDFNSWLVFGNNNNPVNPLGGNYSATPGGVSTVSNSFDTDGAVYDGLGGVSPASWSASNTYVGGTAQAGSVGTAGSMSFTVNAVNAATNPGSNYWLAGLSQNLIGITDLTRALAGTDVVALDYSNNPVDNSGLTAGSYYEMKLLFNFDGNFNQEDVNGPAVNHGTYSTATYANPFIQAPGQTFLQIGYYFNSDFNNTGSDTVSIDNVRVIAPQWVNPAGGDWNNVSTALDANWWTGQTNAKYAGAPVYGNDTGLAPNFQGLEADFLGGDPTDPYTANPKITTSIPVLIGSIVLNNTTWSYTLAASGTGNITITQPGVEPGSISDQGGTHFITAPVILNSSLNVSVTNLGDVLHMSGGISGVGNLAMSGGGTLSLEGAGTYGTSTTVNSGTLIATVTGALPNLTNLLNNGTTNINGNQTLASLKGTGSLVVGNGTTPNTVQLAVGSGLATEGGLTIAANSTLDISNNHMILSYGATDPASTIYSYLKTGYNGGAWTGVGIDSSVANLPANNANYGVGFVDGKDGVPGATVTSGQILIAYALYGDVNLDGLVNATDFAVFGANFNSAVTGWDKGDFTYTGLINATDFALLGANFGKSASGTAVSLPASDFAALDAFAAANGLSLPSVPEPASLGLLAVSTIGILGRRRRRSE